jgi:hypothetical protein
MANDEAVEIKVNVAGKVPPALKTLALSGGDERLIWFLEDLTPGLPTPHPLLTGGVVLRLRSDDSGAGDSTVKLRPCRRSQLSEPWTQGREKKGKWEYRIEGDWTGPRRVLAASLEKTLPAATFASGIADAADASAAFDERQVTFLDACALIPVNLSALVPLGPITSTRWKDVDLGGLTVNAERWQIAGLDFLEMSIRVKNGSRDGAAQQAAFQAAVRAKSLRIDESKDSKTQMVLQHLASAAQ